MKNLFFVILIGLIFIGFTACGGSSSSTTASSGTNTTISGTFALTSSSLSADPNLSFAVTGLDDIAVLAVSSAANSAGDDLVSSIVEANVASDGSFTLSEVPEGTVSLTILDKSQHKMIGLIKFDDAGLVDTSATDSAISLGTLNFDEDVGLATLSDTTTVADIKDANTVLDSTDLVTEEFGSEAPTLSGLSEDLDGDGVANALDPDRDGDGVPDILDRDRDGDGVNNQVQGDFVSTCRYFTPRIFMNNKINVNDLASSNFDSFLLTVNANDNTIDTVTPTAISITAPAYILTDTEILGGGDNCTGNNEREDFSTGELFERNSNNDFCGFIDSAVGTTQLQDNASSGDVYTFSFTGTDSSTGGTVTETCTTVIPFLLGTEFIPQNFTAGGRSDLTSVLSLDVDNILRLEWDHPAGLPADNNGSYFYRYDAFPLNSECNQTDDSRVTESVVAITPSTTGTLTHSTDLNSGSVDIGNTGGLVPDSSYGCWQLDWTINNGNTGDNVAVQGMRVCRNGVANPCD